MQRFPCPFCGLRDEREFRFVGEAGKIRPDTTQTVSDTEWASYMHSHTNPKGPSDEVWVHTTCQELFVMSRDTVSMEVTGSRQLRKDVP